MLNAEFPQKRLCRAEIRLADGSIYRSQVYEPRGEAKENIDCGWLSDKFRLTTKGILTQEAQTEVLDMMIGEGWTVRELVQKVNSLCRL